MRAFAAAAFARIRRACESRPSNRFLAVAFSVPRRLRLDAETVFLAAVGFSEDVPGGCAGRGVLGSKGPLVMSGGCHVEVLSAPLAVPDGLGAEGSLVAIGTVNGDVGACGRANSFP